MKPITVVAATTLCVVLAGCAPDRSPAQRLEPGSAASSQAAAASSEEEIKPVVSGMFDAGGVKRYASCNGSGRPTVVYLHGIDGGAGGAATVPAGLTDHVRFCTYTRYGDTPPETRLHLGSVDVGELHALLSSIGAAPPYVLLGASFGGLLAQMFAATYPDEVAAMVLLDATLPGLTEVYDLIPAEDRKAEVRGSQENLERIDVWATIEQARRMTPQIPDVPVTYLLAVPSDPEEPPNWPVARIRRLLRDQAQEFVDRFSQGRLVTVDSSHYMEPEVPDTIVAEVRGVLQLVS